MKEIDIECKYLLLRKNSYTEADKNFTFNKKVGEISIEVEVSYSRDDVICKVKGATLSECYIQELLSLNRFEGDNLSEQCRNTIGVYFSMALQYTKDILQLIKYHLGHDDLQEQLISIHSERWMLKGDEFRELPISIGVVVSGGNVCPLREDSIQKIEASIESEIVPLLAMRHLHRAKHEGSPHHQWIDATIAAELAIKEVLSRANPQLEALLLNMPSPPLTKLYGKILENYLGEVSPYKKQLAKGSEIRNMLVHRHDSPAIDGQEAVDYVRDVEKAIFHLLTLLYPGDELIRSTYARKTL
ncbi:hypothetical protein AB4369_11955 [Vibrio sp. 10N.261.49.A5]|uniref:Apea-like HEPN domain-containing protein n=1 Tax=Vibrio tasmaniensis 1F-267 TaxID=1191324 RepID=A0ABX3B3D8_9VIBR|nr:hypothetical protein [Vibrio tasmaniensis]OEF45375.1 hypothetical protein A163_09595 [Vibrio tasmaniensis 1F-267]